MLTIMFSYHYNNCGDNDSRTNQYYDATNYDARNDNHRWTDDNSWANNNDIVNYHTRFSKSDTLFANYSS